MDLDALVNEIYRRVQERDAACEAKPEAEANHIGVVGAEDKCKQQAEY